MPAAWRALMLFGSASVSDVRDALEEDLAYTSVLSALQTLEEKGFVRHEAEGRAYRYFPTVEAERAGGSARPMRESSSWRITTFSAERSTPP